MSQTNVPQFTDSPSNDLMKIIEMDLDEDEDSCFMVL